MELFEIELFLHLTVCKQKMYLNKWLTVCIQETVYYAKLNCLK